MSLRSSGTPPRLDGRTIDYTNLVPQPSDDPAVPFSFLTDKVRCEVELCVADLYSYSPLQVGQQGRFIQCHITSTTPEAHKLIRGTGVVPAVFPAIINHSHPPQRVCT